MKDLKQKSIDAIIWNLTGKYGLQFFKISIGVILARILVPEDYGLIGIISVFSAIAMVFMNSGFGASYIQKKDANEIDASSIFFFNLFISIILYLIIWFSAPYIAYFYNHEELVKLIRVATLVLIINAFSMMQLTKLTKEVNFKKKTLINLSSVVISGCFGLILAFRGFGVWSLIFQQITNSFIRTIGIWFFYDWRPRLIISIKSLRFMFSFGSWILLSNLLRSLFDNLNALVIGKYFPISALGYYNKAKGYQQTVSSQPTNAIAVVSFPVFSKLQGDKMALKNSFLKFLHHTLFIVIPIGSVLMVIAKPLIITLLTSKWEPMVIYFQLLLVVGFLYPINTLNIQILLSQGYSKFNFKITFLKNVLRVLNVILMFRLGVLYIIFGEVVIAFLELFINSFYSKKLINYSIFEQIQDVAKIYLSSLIIFIFGFYFIHLFENNVSKIFVGTTFSLIFFILFHYFFNRQYLMSNINLIRVKLKGKE